MEDIKKIFENHWEYYANIGIETYKQQSGQIKQVSEEYAGRVLYELLQNAFDRAESKVLVKYDNKYLYVANDGVSFSFDDYDYKNGSSNKRSDFHSLCSISTSTKDANENIGNKGIGFKSVFSLNEYADIFTKFHNDWISFRIYGEIKKINEDFKEINKNFKIEKKISTIQKEYQDRGIPGFYFPILLNEKMKNFENFVTVIRIKVNKNKIKPLFEELKKIHFYFVKEKIKKDIEIIFETPFDVENKKVTTNDLIYTVSLPNELKEFNIKNPIISIFYKIENSKYDDLLYNFMPTKVKSPFDMADFNADFHTSINRENIKFQGDNEFLLKALMELHLIIIAKKFNTDLKLLNLNILKEEIDKINITNLNFDKKNVWKYLNIKKEFFRYLKEILNEENYIKFIAQIAKQYFEKDDLTKDNYDKFWKLIFKIIHFFKEVAGKETISYKNMLKEVIKELKNNNAKCIFQKKSFNDNIFYYEHDKDKPQVNLENISIINYDFVGFYWLLKVINEIKYLTDYDEILKYFKQCKLNGEYKKDFISKEKQKKILKSVYEIYKKKKEKEKIDNFSYRYEVVFKELEKETKNRKYTKINAVFSISTLFLKTKNNKFKPAQYCHKNEIDTEFLNFIDDNDIENFLSFLGVSEYDDVLCVDFENKKFLEGLDKPPALIKTESKENWNDVIKNIKIYKNNEFKHPVEFTTNALYADILEKIDLKKYSTLKVIIKAIKEFNKVYIELMLNLLEKNKSKKETIIKIYREMYRYKKDYINKYLFLTPSNELNFCNSKNKIYATNNKAYFNLIKRKIDLFVVLTDDKEFKKIDIEIIGSKEKSDIKTILEQYMPYILLKISLSEKSEKDFRGKNLQKLKDKWSKINFYQNDTVVFKINNQEYTETIFDIVYEKDSNLVIHKKDIELYKFSEFLSEFLQITELKAEIENVLLKDISILQKEMEDEIKSIEWISIDKEAQKKYLEKLKKLGYKGDFKYIYYCKDFPNKDIFEIKDIFNDMPELYFKCEKNEDLESFKRKYDLVIQECEKINDILNQYEEKTTINLEEIKEHIKKECEIDDIDKKQKELESKNLPNLQEENKEIKPVEIQKNITTHNKETQQEELEKLKKQIDIAKNKKGINAERIFANSKFANIDKELIKKCINSFIPENWKKTKEKLTNIKTFEDLRISKVSVAAGFDVVITENDKIWLCEIKSVNLDNIYFYLSENEIAKMKYYKCEEKFNEKCKTQWKLILVDEKQCKYIDVTDKVFNLLYKKNCEEKEYLKSLRQKGITYDSLIFHFK